jgi:hypothetical protein
VLLNNQARKRASKMFSESMTLYGEHPKDSTTVQQVAR